MKEINLLGIDVQYTMEDTGKPKLLFIHGYQSTHKFWSALEKVDRSYDMINIELPGNGESKFVGQVSIEFYAEIVREFIHELDLNDLTIVGHSMGGAISMFVGSMDRVSKIVLLNPLNPFVYKATLDKLSAKFILQNIKGVAGEKTTKESVNGFSKFRKNYKERDKYMLRNQFFSKEWQSITLDIIYREQAKKTVGINSELDTVVLPSSIKQTEEKFGIKFKLLKGVGHSPVKDVPDKFNSLLETLIK